MRHFPNAIESAKGHELDHAMSDPEVEGHIAADVIVLGITTREYFHGVHIYLGEYVPEGRERTYDEAKKITLGVKKPSFIDRWSVIVNSPGKHGWPGSK